MEHERQELTIVLNIVKGFLYNILVFVGPPRTFSFSLDVHAAINNPVPAALLHFIVILQQVGYLFFAQTFFFFSCMIFVTLHGKIINNFSLQSIFHQKTWYAQ